MESREYMTIKAYRSQLETAVQRRLATLSRKLHSKGQISEKSFALLNDESRSVAERATNLVSMIMDTVKQNPEYYNHVVEVLRQCGITVLRQLKRERSKTELRPAMGARGSGASLTRSATLAGSRPMMTEERVSIEGNLHKLGRRFKGWHRRYFRIRGCHMFYYKTAKKDKCLGEINLTNCHYCEPSTAATFGAAFEILTTQRSHTLAASSKEEMHRWIDAIKQNITISESAYVKLRNQVTARRTSQTMTNSKRLSKRLSFNEAAYDLQDLTVDAHRERYQTFSKSFDHQSAPQPPPRSSKRPSSVCVRTSFSAEPIAEVEVSLDPSKLSAKYHTIARSTSPPPRPPPPTVKEVGGEGGGVGRVPYVPTLLRNRTLQWDRVRKFLDYAGESMDKELHDTLPRQETPWTEEKSAIEQLRVFLSLDP